MPKGKTWTEQENAICKAGAAEGLTAKQLEAQLPGRNYEQIRSYVSRNHIPTKRLVLEPWSAEEIARLNRVIDESKTYRDALPDLPKRSESAIRHKLTQLRNARAGQALAARIQNVPPEEPSRLPVLSNI